MILLRSLLVLLLLCGSVYTQEKQVTKDELAEAQKELKFELDALKVESDAFKRTTQIDRALKAERNLAARLSARLNAAKLDKEGMQAEIATLKAELARVAAEIIVLKKENADLKKQNKHVKHKSRIILWIAGASALIAVFAGIF